MHGQPTRPVQQRPAPQGIRLPAPRKKRRGSAWLLLGGMAVAGAGVLMLMLMALGAVVVANNGKVAKDVLVAGANVGGLSADEAEALLSERLHDRPLALRDGERSWQTSFSAIGMTFDLAKTMAAVEAARSRQTVMPRYTINLDQSQRGLVEFSEQINIDAVPGRQPQNGRVMEIPVMLERLRVDAWGELSDGVFDLSMMVVEPPELSPLELYTGVRTTHVVQPGQELGLIAKEYNVSMDMIVELNELANPNLIYPGQQLVIPAEGVYQPDASEAPAAPLSRGKSILVDTSTQRVYAYRDGQLVRSHLTSTGRDETPTVLGDYKIYVKFVADDMQGEDYFLPDVPYTMYFYQGYAIHGTYWHNNFGRQMSHGCVNLPVDEAEWFFNFAEVGTLVRVI